MMLRYFVAKCATLESLRTAMETGIWACNERKIPPQPKAYLEDAFKNSEQVVLCFSVNNQHGWHGYAVMKSSPGSVTAELQENTPNWHRFNVEWHTIFMKNYGEQCLPFEKTEHLTIETNEGTLALNKSRNYDEIPAVVGEEVCQLLEEQYQVLVRKKKEKEMEKLKSQPDAFFSPGSDLSINDVWKKLISKVEAYGKILLACPFGSQRYNLTTPESDVDMFIVYAADTKDILGFNPPQPTIKNRETETCDYTILEVHRYCELLLGGDPKCVETLFMDGDTICHADPSWLELVKIRHLFLTRSCLDKYLRDAQGSKGTKYIDRLQQQEQNAGTTKKLQKVSYVVIRLLQNALDTAMIRDLQVFRSASSEEWNILHRVRMGELTTDQIQQVISRLLKSIEMFAEKTPRTDTEPAGTLLQDWLLKLRYENLKIHMNSDCS